ncbi:MAG: LON peptidase substrate-binding domain-containing protein [Hyphomonadaceae bacterium]|nr:LON peptidase substrate-binding domain-containing protein [Hyphomonadaceae bacterium]
MSAFGYRKPADLPTTAPVFPLGGAILFPRAPLPLNIFEPRYLNMVDDALAADRVIGMVQPLTSDARKPALCEVGTLGRITSFSETNDGRYLITLTGVCRFRIERELDSGTPYRRCAVNYDDFARDLHEDTRDAEAVDRARLTNALKHYGDARELQIDWSSVEEASAEALVHAVAALCPFDAAAKQALLEAPTLCDCAATLVALLEFDAAGDGSESNMQ